MTKTKFTPENLHVGMFVINTIVDASHSASHNDSMSFRRTVTFKVVYDDTLPKRRYGICNVLTDGWIHFCGNTIQDVCDFLNKKDPRGSYCLLSKQEFMDMIQFSNQGFG